MWAIPVLKYSAGVVDSRTRIRIWSKNVYVHPSQQPHGTKIRRAGDGKQTSSALNAFFNVSKTNAQTVAQNISGSKDL